jgi:hypothetical protein
MNAENPVLIDLFGVSATRTKDTRLAEHIGGSCAPVAGAVRTVLEKTTLIVIPARLRRQPGPVSCKPGR